jgi:serine/threonine protein phosphatase PrpC
MSTNKKNTIYQQLSKMKKKELIELANKHSIVINVGSKKEDLVNQLFYLANKKTNTKAYKVPRIQNYRSNNTQIHSVQGLRPTMEDTHLNVKLDDIHLMAVFDGHGGNEASDMLPQLVKKYILEPLVDVNLRYNPTKMNIHIREAFKKIDNIIVSSISDESGSTATMLICIEPLIYIVNLGDSRSVIFKYSDIKKSSPILVFETQDHKPDNPEEIKRIYDLGGFVEQEEDDDPRLNGSLATSRAFGDEYLKTNNLAEFKGPLSIEPSIKIIKKKPNFKYFGIVACDGLWDVVESKVAIKYLHEYGLSNGAKNLVDIALYKESSDNISVIVTAI